MKIAITKTETGFNVTLPYELKDSFKQAIPSAKWNAQAKCWTIGPRSGKKAQAWLEQAQEVAKVLEEVQEAEATEQEFEQAIAELARIKKNLQFQQERQQALDVMLAEIAEMQAQISQSTAELEAQKQANAKKQAEIKNTLNAIIDLNAVKEAKETMSRLQGRMTSANRAVFENAQNIINEQRQKLKKAGLGSHGLDDLWYVNWNRPDRDKIAHCRDISEIYKIESED